MRVVCSNVKDTDIDQVPDAKTTLFTFCVCFTVVFTNHRVCYAFVIEALTYVYVSSRVYSKPYLY